MNPILKAIDEVNYRIPKRILAEAFKEANAGWRSTPITIEEQIKNRVIRSRVLVDCNLKGGVEAMIDLQGLGFNQVDTMTIVYHVPKERTQGRTITSVSSVGYINKSMAFNAAGGAAGLQMGSNDVMKIATAVMNSHSAAPQLSSAEVSLIAENTIMIRDINRITSLGYLRCTLEDDANMSHLQIRSIPAFCKLVELAVKSYIYNNLIIEMGSAYLSGGQELGVFKNIVEGYSDAEQMYQDYLKNTWGKVALLNDKMSTTRFLKFMIGPTR